MCGTFTFQAPTARWLSSDPRLAAYFMGTELPGPSFRVLPTQAGAGLAADGPGKISGRVMRWGLLPRDAESAKGNRFINARAATVAEKWPFMFAFRARRMAVVPVTSFYEPRKRQRGDKADGYFHFQRSDGEPLLLAGFWDTWESPVPTESIDTFTIVTCPPNRDVAPIHFSMPAILPDLDAAFEYLRASRPESIQSHLKTAPDGTLRCDRVTDSLYARHLMDDERLVAPWEPPAQGELFAF